MAAYVGIRDRFRVLEPSGWGREPRYVRVGQQGGITRRNAVSVKADIDVGRRTEPTIKRIIDFAAAHNIPAMYEISLYVQDGGLMSYGPNMDDMYRQAATYVDRIFKGAKPDALPVELPNKFEFVIDLKTAKALGLTIPQSLQLRADEVIQLDDAGNGVTSKSQGHDGVNDECVHGKPQGTNSVVITCFSCRVNSHIAKPHRLGVR